MFVAERPSTGQFPDPKVQRFYDSLVELDLADSHLTDVIKCRRRVNDIYPTALAVHRRVFDQESEIVQLRWRSTVTQTDAISTQPGQFVPVNGLNMYYEECGSGKPLILLHGGTVTCHVWQPHLSCFVPHFRVITPDSRAHGRTNNPIGELSYRLMADDVAALIRGLGLIKPLVFGYSDGGQIALEIGMRYPNLTGALVVGAASYRFSETSIAWLKAFGMESAGVVDIEYIQREMPDWVDLWKTEHVCADDPDYWQTLLKQLSVMWWTPLDYTAEDLQKITDPTLILLGDRDGTIELQQAVDMYRLVPNAELAILPNATHLSAIYPARSELTMKIVLDFLLRHSTQAEP